MSRSQEVSPLDVANSPWSFIWFMSWSVWESKEILKQSCWPNSMEMFRSDCLLQTKAPVGKSGLETLSDPRFKAGLSDGEIVGQSWLDGDLIVEDWSTLFRVSRSHWILPLTVATSLPWELTKQTSRSAWESLSISTVSETSRDISKQSKSPEGKTGLETLPDPRFKVGLSDGEIVGLSWLDGDRIVEDWSTLFRVSRSHWILPLTVATSLPWELTKQTSRSAWESLLISTVYETSRDISKQSSWFSSSVFPKLISFCSTEISDSASLFPARLGSERNMGINFGGTSSDIKTDGRLSANNLLSDNIGGTSSDIKTDGRLSANRRSVCSWSLCGVLAWFGGEFGINDGFCVVE